MSFLTNLWARVVAKLGSISRYIGIIAEEIEIGLAQHDVDTIRISSAKAREKATELLALCDALDAAVADGKLTLVEGSELALKLEALVD